MDHEYLGKGVFKGKNPTTQGGEEGIIGKYKKNTSLELKGSGSHKEKYLVIVWLFRKTDSMSL
jgi:hypothetical protein